MIDHIILKVKDAAASRKFYLAALAPLGYSIQMEFGGGVGMGEKGKPSFWFGPGPAHGSVHVAFVAKNRQAVDAFYKAALAAGGKDNGGPGLRPHYHPRYYGAFVFDPDGNNIEAVSHTPA